MNLNQSVARPASQQDVPAQRDNRALLVAYSLSSLFAVAAGAFGAHALRARIVPDMQTVFETGARYHMYHALALFVTAGAFTRWPGARCPASGRRQAEAITGDLRDRRDLHD